MRPVSGAGDLLRGLGVIAAACAVIAAAPPQDDPKQLATVSGVVLSSSGAPIAEASAELYPVARKPPAAGPQPRRHVTTSDASGKFTFEKVVPGTYRFSVSHQVYLIPRSADFGPLNPSTLTLAAGQVQDLRVKLLEPAMITGRTVDEDGDPVSMASVQLLRRIYSDGRRGLEILSYVSSGDDGEFKFAALLPGRYIVRADKQPLWIPTPPIMGALGNLRPDSASERVPIPAAKPGAKVYNPGTTYYAGSNTAAGATLIAVSPGQRIPLGNIKMENRPILHVRGRVMGDPAILAGARVAQIRSDDATMHWSWNYGADIAKDGSFDIPNVRAGNEILIGVVNQKLDDLGFARINVGQQDIEGVVLTASLGPMTGRVVYEEGGALPGGVRAIDIRISSATRPAYSRGTKADADGNFTFPNVAPGLYWVAVFPPEGSYVKSVRINGKELSEQPIDWRGAESGPLEFIVSSKAAVLDGTLLDGDGRPAAGTVTLVPDPLRPANWRWYPTATADAQGSFRFPSLAPGRYKLYAWEEIENTAHWDPDFIRPFESRVQLVEAQEGGRSTVTAKRISAPAMRDALIKAGIF